MPNTVEKPRSESQSTDKIQIGIPNSKVEKPKNESLIINFSDVEFDTPSLKDYSILTFEQMLIYDKREFWTFFVDKFRKEHSLISTFFCFSLLTPQYVRVVSFFLQLNFVFALNALVFTDASVEKSNSSTVNDDV